MRDDDQRLARIIPFPSLPSLPEIELPVRLEHAQRIADTHQGNHQARNITQWIFWIAALFGIMTDVVGRLVWAKIASWPLLVPWWITLALSALIVWFMVSRKIAVDATQFGGLKNWKQLQKLYRAILRYSELREKWQRCHSRSEDEQRGGLWSAYQSLVRFCLPLAEKGLPFDSHLRSAEDSLNEAEMAM